MDGSYGWIIEVDSSFDMPQIDRYQRVLYGIRLNHAVAWFLVKGKVTRVIHKVLSLTKNGWHNRDSFSPHFTIGPLNINTFGQTMFVHCNPLTEDGCTLAPKHSSTSRIVSILATSFFPVIDDNVHFSLTTDHCLFRRWFCEKAASGLETQ